EQKLLNSGIVNFAFVIGWLKLVVADLYFVTARLLHDIADTGNGSLVRWWHHELLARTAGWCYLEHCYDTPGKPYDENRCRQCGREANLIQPVNRVEGPTQPAAALLGCLQLFLQAHARGRQKIRGRFKLGVRRGRHIGAELAGRVQFAGARRTALQMLLHLVASIIRQLVVNVKNDILFRQFAIHNSNPIWMALAPSPIPNAHVIASHSARHATSGWRGTACSWPSLRWCSTSRRWSAASGP